MKSNWLEIWRKQQPSDALGSPEAAAMFVLRNSSYFFTRLNLWIRNLITNDVTFQYIFFDRLQYATGAMIVIN